MIFKDIAEYEDTDSDLAKYTISQLHSKIDYLQDKISKAIEYIESYMPNYDFDRTNLIKVLDILKGEDNERI